MLELYAIHPLTKVIGFLATYLNYGLIACFLYNRAIKIPLLPLAIFYFGWQYILVLSIIMILASVLQGVLVNKLMGVKK